MTPHEIALVQTTFKKVVPIADTAAKLFYDKLFDLDPSLKALFKSDMTEQGAKLMTMIGMAVNSLSDLPGLIPVVQSLGVRHVDYGVEEEHYATVGEALLWTLEQGLGDEFTEQVRAAWTKTYTTLANTMIEASKM